MIDKKADQPDEADEELRLQVLSALGASTSAKRKDAVSGKAASGIETEWLGDGEFYQGFDDANRHEFSNQSTKPSSHTGEVAARPSSSKSTVFPNITQPYCDAAAARVGDMLLPTDDRNFGIDPTPIPDIFEGLDLPQLQENPDPAMVDQPLPTVQLPTGQDLDLQKVKDQFEKIKTEAAKRADKAQERIDDWLQECQYHAEMRKAIDDCAQIGSGVIKGPFPIKRKSRIWERGEDGTYQLIVKEEIKPASRRVDPWNLFPDPACGESIHDGAYIFEREYLTGKKLEEFIGLPGYISSQIRACLQEGPASEREANQRHLVTEASKKHQYEVWYYHGNVTADELRATGCDCGDAPAEKSFPAVLTMVNDRVIRASLNPLDSGEFPYDVIPWKRRPGMPWGMGVARQMRTPQRMVVAATRNLMDNAGLAAGPQIVVRRGVEPENKIWEIKPLKVWVEGDEGEGGATSPVSAVVIPMILPELRSIIELGMELAERVTGLPMLLQGQQGVAPNTATGTQIMNNNGNSLLRRVARLFDSCVTEPHIRRYYAWLMEYSEDEEAKGDFQIVARGSTALVERDIQSQEMIGIVQLSLQGVYGLDPKKTMAEFLKSRRFDPSAFEFTEEELKKMQEQQPPPPPIIAVTEMREQGATQRKQMELEAKAADTQAKLAHETQENALDRQIDQMLADIEAQLASASISSAERINLETIKKDLSSTAMKLRVQKDLSTQQLMTPPTEPAGRAPNGQAFAR